MDISRLRTGKQALSFVGKSWIPKTDKGAVIIVTRDGIVGVNVTAK
jgi:hypothetical protein